MTNFFKWFFHTVVSGLLVGIPLLLKVHPTWLDLSIGGGLTALYNMILVQSQAPIGFAKKPLPL